MARNINRSWLIVLLLVGFSTTTFADVPQNVLDGIVIMYRDATEGWRTVLTDAATHLFWLLAAIDFSWMAISLALRKADLSEIVAELIRRVMIVGFFIALIQNSGSWPHAIVESFRQAAGTANSAIAGGDGISPSNIFNMGLKMAVSLADQVTFSNPAESLARIITGLVIIISFALVAAFLLVALIEMYVALSASTIILGFGGSRWTSEYASKYMSYVVSVGVKLFAMQLLVGIGENFVVQAYSAYQATHAQNLVFVGVAMVLLILVKTIPDTLQGLITGSAINTGAGQLLTAATAAATGKFVDSVAGSAGGAMAVSEAAMLARSEGSSFAMTPVSAIKNLAGAALGEVGAKLAGNPNTLAGTVGGRMAARMREDRLSKMTDQSADKPQNKE